MGHLRTSVPDLGLRQGGIAGGEWANIREPQGGNDQKSTPKIAPRRGLRPAMRRLNPLRALQKSGEIGSPHLGEIAKNTVSTGKNVS